MIAFADLEVGDVFVVLDPSQESLLFKIDGGAHKHSRKLFFLNQNGTHNSWVEYQNAPLRTDWPMNIIVAEKPNLANKTVIEAATPVQRVKWK